MIVIDFLVNIAREYYNFPHNMLWGISGFYILYFVCFAFYFGISDDELDSCDLIEGLCIGFVCSVILGLFAGILPLLLFIAGILYILFMIMFKWGKNYKKLQSYKKDNTSEYVKEIARLEELVKQFEKSK